MRSTLLALACALLLLGTLVASSPYTLEDPADEPLDDYSDNNLERLLQNTQKRSCIRRSGNCDHRPNDCCNNSSCRCNLWGANCRCQRVGLFQKWGK